MKKKLEQAAFVRVGDKIYTPLSTYHPEKNNEAVYITEVEEIYEEDGEIYIIDSDGDKLYEEWLGATFFLSVETMNYVFFRNEERYGKRCTNSRTCNYYSPCARQR